MNPLLSEELVSEWYQLETSAVARALGADPSDGLANIEAQRRLAKYGPNELLAAPPISPWHVLFEQFKNIFILILLTATVLSAFVGDRVEAVVIIIILLFAVVLGFVQEYRAERAIEALRKMAAPSTTVMRDGNEEKVPARELVPGDIVLLHAGDKVAADMRLIETVNLQTDEAALTGESLPVEKDSGPLAAEKIAVADRLNMAYAGTVVTYGRGRAVVVATGATTEFGKIAQMLAAVEATPTPLQVNLDKLGKVLARVAMVIVSFIVVLGLVHGRPFVEMLIFGVALAVAAVPEALPAVVTISLAIGVQRLVKRNALVRRLTAVEALGSTTIICSDKTGTLTKDEMTARRLFVKNQTLEISGVGYEPVGGVSPASNGEALHQLLSAAALASDAHIVQDETTGQWEVRGDPTEGALVTAAQKVGLKKAELDDLFPRIHEIPFTSETKRMTTLHQTPTGVVAYSKGAPEVILPSCTLAASDREMILASARQMAGDALRVLAVAMKPRASCESAEQDMTFLGLVGMIDPPRPEAAAAVQKCKKAGIKVVMVTGDHPLTARAVAHELGILTTGSVLTGAELESLSDNEFNRQVERIEVYARVSPAHKLRIVGALQNRGHITAMTGDGVNDAPTLKKADIGIAMGITGTDVTREAAAMTLTDDNFASIVAAVEEGRGIFDNIKKYLMYLLSSNCGEIGLMAGASLLAMPLPLSAVQILYVNLATDGLPALALAFDPADPDLMSRAPRNPRTGMFTRPVVTLIAVGGLWSTAVNLALFAWCLHSGRSIEESMAMTFASLVVIQFLKAYNFRSDRHSVLHRPFANKWLNRAILWELMWLVIVLYMPFMHRALGTFSLTAADWVIILAVTFTICPVLELAKWIEQRS
jgi:Ca2+-transporting ATPase